MVDFLWLNLFVILYLDVYPRFLCYGIYVLILSIGFVDLTAVRLEHFIHGHLNSSTGQAILVHV